jgi:hypothetical protein
MVVGQRRGESVDCPWLEPTERSPRFPPSVQPRIDGRWVFDDAGDHGVGTSGARTSLLATNLGFTSGESTQTWLTSPPAGLPKTRPYAKDGRRLAA